ncbi:glycosyltransferase [Halalkalibacter hemicellulosilyticus]|uniref:Glycosyl transferase family 1 domain-containing protein n=1 Tax=Halalkalibacter hemicellulosilyticusJCM 9152 TaxID=1236971 RepID=W4QHG2_9BACI|nr:glycosyltransferase [Halalkalibacter hemicellulosilyticus]GAE31352.1 hypothetical protein JCM9152_2813 [Halalkalibacter hemicellulosilyticusJCM 9152]
MKKSLLFVINNFNIGGPQKSLLALLHELDFKKYDVDLLILQEGGKLVEFLPSEVSLVNPHKKHRYAILSKKHISRYILEMCRSLDIKFLYNTLKSIIFGVYKRNMTESKQKFWQRNKEVLPKLEKYYDIAFGVSSGHSLYFIIDCVNAKRKINWIRTDYRVLKRNKKIDSEYISKAEMSLSVSEQCKDIFIDEFKEINPKVEVIYNLLPVNLYNTLPADTTLMKKELQNQINLLTICRLDPHKGLDIAIKCCKILLEEGLNIKWFVLGEGSYKTKVEEMIEEFNLQGSFILLGSHLNTMKYINESDIFVHPSRFEGKSNVVDEAKYLCKPIVVTNYNTATEQINNMGNGIITEIDEGSLAKGILSIIQDKSLENKFIQNLKNDQYDRRISIKKFDNLFS